ncbi:hypothetical protein ACOME3_007540 [Neoechinorhynchus agilis]
MPPLFSDSNCSSNVTMGTIYLGAKGLISDNIRIMEVRTERVIETYTYFHESHEILSELNGANFEQTPIEENGDSYNIHVSTIDHFLNHLGWRPCILKVIRRVRGRKCLVVESKMQLERLPKPLKFKGRYCAIVNPWMMINNKVILSIIRRCRCRCVMELVPVFIDGNIKFYLKRHETLSSADIFIGDSKFDQCPVHGIDEGK